MSAPVDEALACKLESVRLISTGKLEYVVVATLLTLVWSMVIVFLLVHVPPVLYHAAWAGVED